MIKEVRKIIKMPAKRINSFLGIFMEFYRPPFHESPSFTCHQYIRPVAGCWMFNEKYFVIYFGNALTFCGIIQNSDIVDNFFQELIFWGAKKGRKISKEKLITISVNFIVPSTHLSIRNVFQGPFFTYFLFPPFIHNSIP